MWYQSNWLLVVNKTSTATITFIYIIVSCEISVINRSRLKLNCNVGSANHGWYTNNPGNIGVT